MYNQLKYKTEIEYNGDIEINIKLKLFDESSNII